MPQGALNPVVKGVTVGAAGAGGGGGGGGGEGGGPDTGGGGDGVGEGPGAGGGGESLLPPQPAMPTAATAHRVYSARRRAGSMCGVRSSLMAEA
jgi:hypothetical protein